MTTGSSTTAGLPSSIVDPRMIPEGAGGGEGRGGGENILIKIGKGKERVKCYISRKERSQFCYIIILENYQGGIGRVV